MQPNYPQQQYPAQYPGVPAGYAGPAYVAQPAPANPYMGPTYGAPAMYPAAPAAPVQPSAPGSLDGFYGQPSASGGPSWKFQGKPVGTTYAGIVERPVTDADVRQQTNNAGVPQTYRDGRPKFIMVVPMLVQQSPEFPEGRAGWWVKGQARDELVRAMAEAGAPTGAPEAGALIQVTLVGQRPIPGMNPAYQYRIVYTRPSGDPASAVSTLPAPAPAPQYAPPQYAAQPAQPVYAPPAAQYAPPMPAQPAYAPQAPVAAVPAPAAMAAVAAGVPAPVAGAGAPGLTPEQLALMSRLTGASA